MVRKVWPQLSVRSTIAGQIDAAFADQPAAELDREAGRREQRRRVAERVVERVGDAVDVERLVAGPAGDVEAAAKIELGQRHADRIGYLAGLGDRHAVDFGERLGIEALRAAEHVQAAPVDVRLEQALDEGGHALGIDPERARPGRRCVTAALFDAKGGVTRTEMRGWMPTRSAARIARSASPSLSTLMVAPAATAASSSSSSLPGPAKLIGMPASLASLQALAARRRETIRKPSIYLPRNSSSGS